MTEYFGQGDGGLSSIPTAPAIYLWTVDLTRLSRLPTEAACTELDRLMRLPIRTFRGRVTPFYGAEITDSPTPLSADRASKLRALMASDNAARKWLLLYATTLQRPLYIGQTSDLQSRFRTHVRPGSTFRSYLDEAALTLRDCSLAFIRLPAQLVIEPSLEDQDGSEEDDDSHPEVSPSILMDLLESILHRLARPLLARKIE